jgi:hypothetical protein
MPRSNAPSTPTRRLSNIPQAELDSVVPDSPSVGICERYYKCNGEKLCELMAMCLGLESSDDIPRLLGDTAVEPYASMKFRKKVNPTQKHMSEEVKRRVHVFPDDGEPAPQCTYKRGFRIGW